MMNEGAESPIQHMVLLGFSGFCLQSLPLFISTKVYLYLYIYSI